MRLDNSGGCLLRGEDHQGQAPQEGHGNVLQEELGGGDGNAIVEGERGAGGNGEEVGGGGGDDRAGLEVETLQGGLGQD